VYILTLSYETEDVLTFPVGGGARMLRLRNTHIKYFKLIAMFGHYKQAIMRRCKKTKM